MAGLAGSIDRGGDGLNLFSRKAKALENLFSHPRAGFFVLVKMDAARFWVARSGHGFRHVVQQGGHHERLVTRFEAVQHERMAEADARDLEEVPHRRVDFSRDVDRARPRRARARGPLRRGKAAVHAAHRRKE